MAGRFRCAAAVVVVLGAWVTGLRAWSGASRGTVGNECTRERPLGTLEYEAMKPSDVTLWSDTNWTRRTLLLVTMGLETDREESEKENRNRNEIYSYNTARADQQLQLFLSFLA